MNCDELRDYYEMFTLGLAEEPESSEIREHLGRDCPTCVPGVRNARELMTLVGASAPPAQPPPRLRKRVLAAVGGEPARRWNWSPVWAALAAGAVIAAVIFNVQKQHATAELASQQARAATQTRELARLNEAFAILTQPDAKQVVFGGAAPQPPRGRIFIDPQRGVLLLASNLPPVAAGRTYEMWVIPKAPGSKPVPAGLFQAAGDGTAMHVLPGPVDVNGTAAVAVTVERAEGATVPNLPPVFAAAL